MNNFTLLRPTSLEQVFPLLPKEDGDRSAVLLAGGQDLLTEMDEHLVEPERVISLRQVAGLDGIRAVEAGGLELGALVRLASLEKHALLGGLPPEESASTVDVDSAGDPAGGGSGFKRGPWTVLAEAANSVASPQIRSQATLGGNLNQRPRCLYFRLEEAKCLKKGGSMCFAADGRNKLNAILGAGPSYIVHPSDLAPALVTLDAEVELRSSAGTRRMPLEQYYLLPRDGRLHTETELQPGEVLTHVHLPPRDGAWRSIYLKFKERESYDFALVSVALGLWVEGRTIVEARVCLGGVAPKPWRLPLVEEALTGAAAGELDYQALGDLALKGANPLSENGYKLELVRGLLRRALENLGA
jgi:xanthine dehydrogenase YagS FAD-binding subunit